MDTWRDHARPIIAKVIFDTVGDTRLPYTKEQVKMIRKNLLEAYPYGSRENHPYKIWLDEIRKQLKVKPRTFKQVETNQINIFLKKAPNEKE